MSQGSRSFVGNGDGGPFPVQAQGRKEQGEGGTGQADGEQDDGPVGEAEQRAGDGKEGILASVFDAVVRGVRGKKANTAE